MKMMTAIITIMVAIAGTTGITVTDVIDVTDATDAIAAIVLGVDSSYLYKEGALAPSLFLYRYSLYIDIPISCYIIY